MNTLVLIGAGGYAKTLADLVRQTRAYEKVIFLDDNPNAAHTAGVCADYVKFIGPNTAFYPAFGNNEVRLKWLHTLQNQGLEIPVFIHPTAYVSPTVKLEAGVVVLPLAVVNTDCYVSSGCIINCGAIVDHDCIIEEGVHLCAGAVVKAENRLPAGLKVEAGEVILNRVYPR
ncbi:MAG: hypothetical protein IKN49_06615 [Elusimicrobiaceae bacterium]|nr:hypothetical protein [Elusimicrobiaceae bacterium]